LHRRRRGDSPPMPEQLATRDDVTLAQKQRLAMLAKMGVGPVAGAPNSERRALPAPPSSSLGGPALPGPPGMMDRRAAMLERERKFREQEEKQNEQEEAEEQAKREKRARARGGMQRLGPVQPREDEIPQFLPAPAQVPEYRPKADNKMELKISKETAERAKGSSVGAGEDGGDDDREEDKNKMTEEMVLALIRSSREAKAGQKKRTAPQEQQKQGKKKRKKKGDKEGEWQDLHGEDEDYDDDDDQEDLRNLDRERAKARDGGINPGMMQVENVRGKVSNANKNLTDVDLERRFQMQQDRDRDSGSLMTEEQVLKMIRREKTAKPSVGSTSKRIQRELAEWELAKEQQRARVKSPHRFERMVVARK